MAFQPLPDYSVSDAAKFTSQEIMFQFVLNEHIRSIMKLRALLVSARQIDEYVFSFVQAVDSLEDLLAAYFDAIYEDGVASLKDVERGAEVEFEGEAISVRDKGAALEYARAKFKLLMQLLGRKNLLLRETEEPPIIEADEDPYPYDRTDADAGTAAAAADDPSPPKTEAPANLANTAPPV
jgi:hypothetical protein